MKANGKVQSQFSECSYIVSPWSNSPWKRRLDVVGAILLLVLLLPLMFVVALAVKLTSPGPVLFRQRRPGRGGREFSILKFRTMLDARRHVGPMLTQAEDPRVTWFGRYLRKWKLDELPQLFNVLRGHMSFVGPRPQPTRLWHDPTIQDEVACILSVRPGITSQATLNFRNEEELLAPLSTDELEEVYMTTIMPLKLKMDLEYLQNASFGSDLSLIFKTVFRVCNPHEQANDLMIKQHLAENMQKAYMPVIEQKEYVPAVEQAD